MGFGAGTVQPVIRADSCQATTSLGRMAEQVKVTLYNDAGCPWGSYQRDRAEARSAALDAARSQQAAALETLQSQVSGWTDRLQKLEAMSASEAGSEVGDWLGDWAIPEAIVMCESGGNWDAVNPSSGAGGAYQILPSTWALYGGEGKPQDASPAEQSAIAAQIWADSGPGAWVCAQ